MRCDPLYKPTKLYESFCNYIVSLNIHFVEPGSLTPGGPHPRRTVGSKLGDVRIRPNAVYREIPEQDDDDRHGECQITAQNRALDRKERSIAWWKCRRDVGEQPFCEARHGTFRKGKYWSPDHQADQIYAEKLCGLMGDGFGTRIRVGPIAIPYEIADDGSREGAHTGE